MSDVIDTQRNTITDNINDLYLYLCEIVSRIVTERGYNHPGETKNAMMEFRYNFIQFFYLIRVNENFDDNLEKEIEKWSRIWFKSSIPNKYYDDTIKLFNKTVMSVKKLGIIKI